MSGATIVVDFINLLDQFFVNMVKHKIDVFPILQKNKHHLFFDFPLVKCVLSTQIKRKLDMNIINQLMGWPKLCFITLFFRCSIHSSMFYFEKIVNNPINLSTLAGVNGTNLFLSPCSNQDWEASQLLASRRTRISVLQMITLFRSSVFHQKYSSKFGQNLAKYDFIRVGTKWLFSIKSDFHWYALPGWWWSYLFLTWSNVPPVSRTMS